MQLDELKQELGRLDVHRTTPVVLGGSWADPHRVDVVEGQVVIGSELNYVNPDDHDCEEGCEAAHLLDANVDILVAFLAGIAQPDAAQLASSAKRSLEEASIDDLTHWLAHREAQRQETKQALGGGRSRAVDTRPL